MIILKMIGNKMDILLLTLYTIGFTFLLRILYLMIKYLITGEEESIL